MYFKNKTGETYLLDNKIAVLNTFEGRYSFESNDIELVQRTYQDFVSILEILEKEELYFDAD